MDTVKLKVNGQPVEIEKDATLLEAARKLNINIPTLCFLKDINEIGACRMCLVEVKGARSLQAACIYPVSEGLEVFTNTQKVRDARRLTLELILSDHDKKCLSCIRNNNCELQTLSEQMGVDGIRFEDKQNKHIIDDLSPSIVRDPGKCILCRRCISVCRDVQTVNVIDTNYRGFKSVVGCAFDKPLAETACVNCGQCIAACPTGALREKSNVDQVWQAISDPDKHVVVQVAPAVRGGLGEQFGEPVGTLVTGQMAAALRRIGFDQVFDTNTAADVTIMEEGTELLQRIQNNGKLPLITSCSPGWVKFCETYFPEFIPNLSSAKSPQSMFGALIKTYYAQQKQIDPKTICVVSVMPCTAKKFEVKREELSVDGLPDVDISITTRELAQMIKQSGIDFVNLPDEGFDNPFETATGAGAIFGATGGVMEAALRTVADVMTGQDLNEIEYTAVRGTEGIKEAAVQIGDTTVNVAAVSGLGNARKLLEQVRNGEKNLHFIEIMACPGGCVNGGGQPIVSSKTRLDSDVKKLRAGAVYQQDEKSQYRKSHKNPIIIKLYKDFLGEPCGHLSHKLLHTSYAKKQLH